MSEESGSNKGRALQFRSDVVLHLHAAGFRTASVPREVEGLTLDERQRRNRGDVLGLDPWTIATRNQRHLDLSEAQNEVSQEARNSGHDLYASIQNRKNHPLDESYVTMPLGVFIKVLRELHPELVDQCQALPANLARGQGAGGREGPGQSRSRPEADRGASAV